MIRTYHIRVHTTDQIRYLYYSTHSFIIHLGISIMKNEKLVLILFDWIICGSSDLRPQTSADTNNQQTTDKLTIAKNRSAVLVAASVRDDISYILQY